METSAFGPRGAKTDMQQSASIQPSKGLNETYLVVINWLHRRDFLCLLPNPMLSPLTLNAGQELVVDFTLNSSLASGINPPLSLLTLGLGTTSCGFSPNVCDSVGNITTSLYNGNTLLGTYTFTANPFNNEAFEDVALFKSSTSLLTVDSPTVVDTTSLQNGTIDGHLVVTISSGSLSNLEFGSYPTDGTELNLTIGSANSANNWNGYGGWLYSSYSASVIDAPAAATPEPSSLMLLGTGIFGAAGMIRRRRAV